MISEFNSETVSSSEGLEKLREEWNTLEPARSSPLCRWEWFYSGALAFHCRNHLKTVVVRRAGRVAAVAPLVEVSVPTGSYLTFIGSATLHEPCDLIYDDLPALEFLIKCLYDLGLPCYYERLPLESSTSEKIGLIFHGRGVVIQKSAGSTCYLPMLQRSWGVFLAGMPSKKRYDVKRVYKRAEDAGTVHCEIISPDPDNLPGLLEQVFSIEARSWKGEVGSAILSNPTMETFFRRYCALAVEEGYLRIAFLTLQDSPAAALIGAVLGNRFWVFKIGYDAQWSRFSPGILLINETIRYAFQKGFQAYEFLGSDESWIQQWTGKENLHQHSLVAFYPYNFQGALRLATDGGKFLWRRVTPALRKH